MHNLENEYKCISYLLVILGQEKFDERINFVLVKKSSQRFVETIMVREGVDLHMSIDWHWCNVCCKTMSVVEELRINIEVAL